VIEQKSSLELNIIAPTFTRNQSGNLQQRLIIIVADQLSVIAQFMRDCFLLTAVNSLFFCWKCPTSSKFLMVKTKNWTLFSAKDYDQVYATMRAIENMLNIDVKPKIGIICGSGLGKIADMIEIQSVLPYSKLPNLPQTSGNSQKTNLH
jgi:hypothetical protein